MSRSLAVALLLLLAGPSGAQVSRGVRDSGAIFVCPVGVPCLPAQPTLPIACFRDGDRVEQLIAALADRYDHCRRDSDCVRVDATTACRGSCGVLVNRRLDWRFARQVRHLGETRCSADCPFTRPLCLPSRAVCVNRQCREQPLAPLQLGPPHPKATRNVRRVPPAEGVHPVFSDPRGPGRDGAGAVGTGIDPRPPRAGAWITTVGPEEP